MLHSLHLSPLPVQRNSTHGKNNQSALAEACSENTGCPHCLLAGPFLFAEMCVLGNSQNPMVGTEATECSEGLWEVAGSLCCTFEYLFLITPFVLNIANGSQTWRTVKRLRWWSASGGHAAHQYPARSSGRARKTDGNDLQRTCKYMYTHRHTCTDVHTGSGMWKQREKGWKEKQTQTVGFLVAFALSLARMDRLSHPNTHLCSHTHAHTFTQAKYVLIASMRR